MSENRYNYLFGKKTVGVWFPNPIYAWGKETKPGYIISGSMGIASEKVRKKEEVGAIRESPLQEKKKPYMAVDISPNFTRDHTNGHDIR